MKDKLKKNDGDKLLSIGSFYGWPMGLWFLIFFVAPLVIIFIYSFLKKGTYGGVEWIFSLKAYKQIFKPEYGLIVLRTLKITIISTLITILISIPSAYAMARSKHQTFFLFLIIIPFWTNSLIRIFAWMSILNNDGILNQILMSLHLTKEYIPFLYNTKAVILVSVYMYIPYAILPIFTAVDRFDFSLLEAARDLGATKPVAMIKILLPGIKSGVVSALIFTFIPIFGAYTVPLLVGGKDSYMLGNIIVDQVQKTRNWPLASTFSIFITIISVAGILWITKTNKKDAQLKKSTAKEENYVSGGTK
ncbi:MAG: ABC transporter permease [Treponema sp.]|nr:ABC transporter permease [Treponema sp.]MCI5666644.1 ABC transporter permease [Spirochaetia bacterium]MDD7767246.1 ABC transporter permease [Treponema sp.]MDY3132232.1 ABC transporter permease [Treponema sp.]